MVYFVPCRHLFSADHHPRGDGMVYKRRCLCHRNHGVYASRHCPWRFKVKIPVIYDTDETVTSNEGQQLYKNDIVWCQRFNIQTVADLETRIVDSSEYQSLWIDRCDYAYNLLTQTNECERLEIQRQYPDLFLYGTNNDLTMYYFENRQGQLFEFTL